jgi:phosphopantothenoylcysteine decarboxylase
MNTLMWQHPSTARHLRQLAADQGSAVPPEISADELPDWINAHCRRLRLVAPVSRMLACGDEGVGALAAPQEVVATLMQLLGVNPPPPPSPRG